MTRAMTYTCEVQCWDNITRIFEQVGYFNNTDTLRHCLARWNGCAGPAGTPYRYYETRAQVTHNDGSCCISEGDVPWNKCFWHGRVKQLDWSLQQNEHDNDRSIQTNNRPVQGHGRGTVQRAVRRGIQTSTICL
jgi:hypothetical protein